MRRQHDVVERREPGRHVRLVVEDVEPGSAQSSCRQRLGQRRLVDQPAARDVDENAARSQCLDDRLIDDRPPRSLRRAGGAEEQDVGAAGERHGIRVGAVRNLARHRVDIADVAPERLQPPRHLDADPPEPDDARAHASELASERQAVGAPATGAHEAVAFGHPAARRKRQADRKVGNVVVEHWRDRDDDAALARRGDVAGFKPNTVQRAYFELRHQLHVGARQSGHAVASRTTNARAELLQGGERIRIGIDVMQRETLRQPLDDLRQLGADQRYFYICPSIDCHAWSSLTPSRYHWYVTYEWLRCNRACDAGHKHQSLTGEELGFEFTVHECLEAFSFKRGVPRVVFEHVEGDPPDEGEIAGGVVFSRAAPVFVEGNVELPMKVVLDCPVRADRLEKENGIGRERSDVVNRRDRAGCWQFAGVAAGIGILHIRNVQQQRTRHDRCPQAWNFARVESR